MLSSMEIYSCSSIYISPVYIVLCKAAEQANLLMGPDTGGPEAVCWFDLNTTVVIRLGHMTQSALKLASCCLNPCWPHRLNHSVIHKIVDRQHPQRKGYIHNACNMKINNQLQTYNFIILF